MVWKFKFPLWRNTFQNDFIVIQNSMRRRELVDSQSVTLPIGQSENLNQNLNHRCKNVWKRTKVEKSQSESHSRFSSPTKTFSNLNLKWRILPTSLHDSKSSLNALSLGNIGEEEELWYFWKSSRLGPTLVATWTSYHVTHTLYLDSWVPPRLSFWKNDLHV